MTFKSALAGAILTALICLAGTPLAQAKSCTSISCLQSELNSLTKQVKSLKTKLTADEKTLSSDNKLDTSLSDCLEEGPITQYGDPAGTYGFSYTPSAGATAVQTTAVDITRTGTTVDAWVLIDGCNTETTPPTSTSTSVRKFTTFGPIAPLAPAAIFAPQAP